MKKKQNIKCIICKSYNTQFHYSELNTDLYFCITCNLLFVYPLPEDETFKENLELDYVLLAHKYSKKSEPSTSNSRTEEQIKRWEQEKRKLFKKDLDFIKNHLPIKNSPHLILDIGCDEGHFLLEASKIGFICQGLEPSKIHAHNKKIDNIYQGFLKDFKPQKKFDVITMLDVLEHTKNPLNELKHVQKIISPEGILMIRVPNLRWLFLKEKLLKLFCFINKKEILDLNPQGIYAPSTHLYNFSEHALNKILEQAGFKIIAQKIINASHSENTLKNTTYKIYYSFVNILYKITKINLAISLNVIAVLKKKIWVVV